MRQVTILLFLLLSMTGIKGQALINVDSCGIDCSPRLNKYEMIYFKNKIKWLENVNFEDMKIAFACGNLGNLIICKKDYFEKWGKDYYKNGDVISNTLIQLSIKEKELSGGYDYVIISWTKILPTGNGRRKLIERIRLFDNKYRH